MKKINLPIEFENSVEMWESYGFLDGLDDKVREVCVNGFDNVTEYLLDNDIELAPKIEVLIYPTVRKIIQTNDKIEIKAEVLVNMLVETYKELKKIYDIKNDAFNIDIEAETCAKVIEDYINKKEG